MKTLVLLLLAAAAAFAQEPTVYINGNNAGAVAARKDFSKACHTLTLVQTSKDAEYVLDIELDANGAANGTLSKGADTVWSDSYDSTFYHESDRGKLNGKLLIAKFGKHFCRAAK